MAGRMPRLLTKVPPSRVVRVNSSQEFAISPGVAEVQDIRARATGSTAVLRAPSPSVRPASRAVTRRFLAPKSSLLSPLSRKHSWVELSNSSSPVRRLRLVRALASPAVKLCSKTRRARMRYVAASHAGAALTWSRALSLGWRLCVCRGHVALAARPCAEVLCTCYKWNSTV
jgi:hypothetical protein